MKKFLMTVIVLAVVAIVLVFIFCDLYANDRLPHIVYKWVESNETVHAIVDKLIEHHIWDTIINNVKEDIDILTPKAE